MSRFRNLLRGGFKIPQFMRWEAFLIRAFTAVAVYLTMPGPTKPIPDAQKFPTGLAHIFDLTFYASPGVMDYVRWTVIALLVLYVSGRFLAASLPTLALIHITLFTLFNSQGDTNHNRQIVSMVLLAQSIVVLWPLYHRLFRREKLCLPPGRQLSHYMIFFSQQAVVGIYVISAITKLIRSKGLWIFQTPNLAVDLVKTHDQDFYSDLKLDEGLALESVIAFMANHPLLTILLLAPGLILELFAFLALYNRTAGLVVGLMLIAMHEMISQIFHLNFGENVIIVLIYLVNVPFWLFFLGTKLGWIPPGEFRSKADAPSSGPPEG